MGKMKSEEKSKEPDLFDLNEAEVETSRIIDEALNERRKKIDQMNAEVEKESKVFEEKLREKMEKQLQEIEFQTPQINMIKDQKVKLTEELQRAESEIIDFLVQKCKTDLRNN